MSNKGRCAVCPFYLTHSSKSITCEDSLRRYSSSETRRKHMNKYCYVPAWTECVHAIALANLYELMSDMPYKEQRLMYLEHVTQAQRREISKLCSLLGVAERNNAYGNKVNGSPQAGSGAGEDEAPDRGEGEEDQVRQ